MSSSSDEQRTKIFIAKPLLFIFVLEWDQVLRKFVPSSLKLNVTTAVISPLYTVKSICALRIALNLQSETPFQVHIVFGKEQEPIPVNFTTGQCQEATIEDSAELTPLESPFRLALLIGSKLNWRESLFGSISTHKCTKFQPFTANAKPSVKPIFENLRPGEENICSFEYIKGEVDCNWMQVIDEEGDQFKRKATHDCIGAGALGEGGRSDVWFLFHTTSQPQTRSFLVSPIIVDVFNSITVILMYINQCSNTTLRYYVITSLYEIDEIKDGVRTPDQVVQLIPNAYSWIDLSVNLSVPKTNDSFQVTLCKI